MISGICGGHSELLRGFLVSLESAQREDYNGTIFFSIASLPTHFITTTPSPNHPPLIGTTLFIVFGQTTVAVSRVFIGLLVDVFAANFVSTWSRDAFKLPVSFSFVLPCRVGAPRATSSFHIRYPTARNRVGWRVEIVGREGVFRAVGIGRRETGAMSIDLPFSLVSSATVRIVTLYS